LAELSREYQGRPKDDPPSDLLLAKLDQLASQWGASTGAIAGAQRQGAAINTAAWWARVAEQRRQRLYLWSGPGVPWTLSRKGHEHLVNLAQPRPGRLTPSGDKRH
jgi:hypothetical protein